MLRRVKDQMSAAGDAKVRAAQQSEEVNEVIKHAADQLRKAEEEVKKCKDAVQDAKRKKKPFEEAVEAAQLEMEMWMHLLARKPKQLVEVGDKEEELGSECDQSEGGAPIKRARLSSGEKEEEEEEEGDFACTAILIPYVRLLSCFSLFSTSSSRAKTLTQTGRWK